MRPVLVLLLALASAAIGLRPIAAAAADPEIPPALESWRGWALHGAETAACPVRDETLAVQCRWPGVLRLQVDASGLRFEQEWTVHVRQRVPLPGSVVERPIDVEVDGRAAPVVADNGVPTLALEPGTHRVRGRIAWPRRPATLAVPDELALIELRVDGATIARPERDDSGALVLGSEAADESDALQIETFRLLGDGVPQVLATRLWLSVSGRPREVTLPPLLPEGFVPMALASEVPARLESDGRLRLQLRSGNWSLTLMARALEPVERIARPPVADTWPEQELWQFRSAPDFRVAQLVGLPGVDPAQVDAAEWDVDVPDELATWSPLFDDAESLPAFLFEAEAEARIEVALRGLPASHPPRLHLSRELWLDFDGDAFSARDRISGELGAAARLDLRAPWQMQRASSAGAGLLITQGDTPQLNGVELRDSPLDLEVDARVARDGVEQASGWNQPFDSARAVLHLPPGYRLLAATGTDHAGDSWWQRWNLLDLFLLSVIVLLAWRYGGLPLLALTLVWGVLSWHEPEAPRYSVLLLLLLALAARALATGRGSGLLRAVRNLIFAAVVVLALAFAATGLRLALYPQLERSERGAGFGLMTDAGFAPRERSQQEDIVEMVMAEPLPAPAPQSASPEQRQRLGKSQDVLDRIEVTGSRIKAVDLFAYPADAIVQSGSARPGWHWHRHDLGWNGPLLPDDAFGLIVSPPPLTRLWRALAVVLMFVLVWRVWVGRAQPLRTRGTCAAASSPAMLVFALLAGGMARDAEAQTLPDEALLQELRSRLVARDEACRPQCAALGSVVLSASREYVSPKSRRADVRTSVDGPGASSSRISRVRAM